MGLMPGVQGGAVSQKTSLNPAFDILFGAYLLLPLLFIKAILANQAGSSEGFCFSPGQT
jgi:hypothetical protein